MDERLALVTQAEAYMRSYMTILDHYHVVPEAEKALYTQNASSVTDAAKRRELKIKQYQKEKEIRSRIEAVRKRRYQTGTLADSQSDLELIASLLPDPSKPTSSDPEEDDADTEDFLRETTLLLLRLTYAQAQAQLESMCQELELLRSAPTPPPRPDVSAAADLRRQQDADMWRVDAPRQSGGPDGKGPLLDSSGKPLRPFTILPSAAADRARLQAQVFQPDHRLPTMSIDEYLEIEQQRGNIISGGGPQSEANLTTSEQLALDSEMDGTAFGEERAEEKRQKDEAWARYTDTHPKGAGNTLNRG